MFLWDQVTTGNGLRIALKTLWETMKLSCGRSCGLVIEVKVSPGRYQRKSVHTNTQEKEKMFLTASRIWTTKATVHHPCWPLFLCILHTDKTPNRKKEKYLYQRVRFMKSQALSEVKHSFWQQSQWIFWKGVSEQNRFWKIYISAGGL